jgi:fatty acid-binding protein DegV
MKRVIQFVSDLGPLEQLALVHTNAPQEAQFLYHQAKHLFPNQEEPLSVEVTPVLGANIGPGVVGFACIIAEKTI